MKLINNMKTYLRKLKSGNYEVANSTNFTHEFETKEQLEGFFLNLRNERVKSIKQGRLEFVPARIVKSRYRQSHTYFRSFNELWNSLK